MRPRAKVSKNAPSRSVFRYSHAVAKLRGYRQRERARGRARTHAAIEAATLRESAKRGYAGLRMTEIARRARISPRTVYLHAPSKERLVQDTLRRRADGIIRRVERWQPRSETPEGILNELVALHERTYRTESATLETLTSGGVPREVAEILRELDDVRTWYLKLQWKRTRSTTFDLRYEFEDDPFDEYHTLLLGATWRF